MEFSNEDIQEFCQEATELLEAAEESLLSLDKGGDFQSNYDAIFRAFHSTKGGAGMMELTALQSHMHQLENLLVQCKSQQRIPKTHIDFFLRGIDAAKSIMAGQTVSFNYTISETPAVNNTETSKEAKVIPIQNNRKTKENRLGLVVVVDDEQDIVELLSNILTDDGFEVAGFTRPKEALDFILKNSVDMVFTDYKMPQMNGFEMATLIGKKYPELPIVVVSGHIKGSVVVAGIYAIIEKPFSDDFILQSARHAINRYQLIKLLNRTVDLLIYQFSDLDDYLKSQGKHEVRKTLANEINTIMELRSKIRALDKRAA
jgi:CheY-like chemotaxis protein/HPt (histidine-containing phosphotransfer) domain-containing protein